MAAHDANGKSNSLKKSSGDLDLFDQIQDEFDALLAGDELPEPQDIDADKQNTLTDLVLQDTNEFLSTTDMRAFDMPSDKPADAPAASEGSDDAGIPDSIGHETKLSESKTSSGETDTGDLPTEEPKPAEAATEAVMAETASEAVAYEDDASTDETQSTPSSDTVEDSLPQVQEDDSVSEPDEEPESITPEITDDSSDPGPVNKIFLQETDLSDTDPAEQAVNRPPASDKHASELDGIDPFSDDMDDDARQEKAPVHPDMSEDSAMPRRGGGRMMMLVGVIVLTVAGSIYWLTSETQEPAEQLASNQDQPVSNTADLQPALSATPSAAPSTTPAEKQPTPKNIQTAATILNKKDSPVSDKAVAVQPTETKKAAIQRAAVEKAKAQRLAAKQEAEKRAAAEKSKVQRLAAKQAAEKRAAAEKAKAQRLAEKQAAKNRVAAEKAAARKLAVIQPTTPLQKSPVKAQVVTISALDEPGNWIIELASVNSDKSARQHMARILAMGVESTAVQVNDKGRIFHSIRITGFTSKQEAMKRRDALAKRLGVRGAKVERL